jgi:hypothetical protein
MQFIFFFFFFSLNFLEGPELSPGPHLGGGGNWLQLPRAPVFWGPQNFVVGNLLTCELLNFKNYFEIIIFFCF